MKRSLILLSLLSFVSYGSWYPADHPFQRDCQEKGDVKVCIINKNQRKPYIAIEYSGYLITENWGKLKAWVSVNGVSDDGFEFENETFKEYLFINRYNNIMMCYRNLRPVYGSDQYPVCPGTYSEEISGKLDWYHEDISLKDKELFSQVYPFQRNWDIEVAIYNEKGEWDSNFGDNYSFIFDL